MLEYLHCGILQKGNYRWAWQGWDFQMPMSVPPSATATAIASGALTRFAKNWIFDWIWFAFVLTIWPRPRLHSHSTHSTHRKASIAAAGGGGGGEEAGVGTLCRNCVCACLVMWLLHLQFLNSRCHATAAKITVAAARTTPAQPPHIVPWKCPKKLVL